MKRLLLLLAFSATLIANVAAASSAKALADSIRPNWTIGFKAGFTHFTLSAEQNGKFLSNLSHEFSVFSEYAFVTGVGLGAYFGNYSYNRPQVLGSSLELGFYAHLSLLELFAWSQAPAVARRFHMYWDTGMGAAAIWQNNQVLTGTIDRSSSEKVFWHPYAVIRTALQFEFMVKPQWGLFLEGAYHGYGRPRYPSDSYTHAAPWISAVALNAGFRYYFDDRPKPDDPRLDKDQLPIRKQRDKETQTNVYYINVDVTPEMLAGGGGVNTITTIHDTVYIQTEASAAPISVPRSQEVESALKVLQEQGEGTVLINSIHFDSEAQLTEDAMEILDKVAGSLTTNHMWTKITMLYSSDRQATSRAVVIAAYLRAKGVHNLTIKGFDAPTSMPTSDLIITIR